MRPFKDSIQSNQHLHQSGLNYKHSSRVVSSQSNSGSEIKPHDWQGYSLKLQKQIESLKLQNQDLQLLLIQKGRQIQKLTKQIEYYRTEIQKALVSSQIQENILLKQQLKQANKLTADLKIENKWLQSKIQNKGEQKQYQPNLIMEEEMRSLRYSYEIFQKKMETLMEDVSKYQCKCDQLTQENKMLKLMADKGNNNTKNLNENIMNEIKALEENFKMYLELKYFDESN